jgi:hypothetical protein
MKHFSHRISAVSAESTQQYFTMGEKLSEKELIDRAIPSGDKVEDI